MKRNKRVLSAIQPTGDIHLGNYFGAIQNWVRLQDQYDCIYGIVDYHAMTTPYKPDTLRANTWKMAFQLLACGIRPEHLFIQSMIPEHTELAWILGCVASYGEATRMTQFKDKAEQLRQSDKNAFISVGLFTYPVLQAADILIYKAQLVPVGKDQEQHLEFTRNIAVRFNHQFHTDYFPLPEPLFTETPKIKSLADPTKKMSKSLGEKHYLSILESPETIRKRIRSAVTDTQPNPETMSPGVENLFTLLRATGEEAIYNELLNQYHNGTLRYVDLKDAVAEGLIKLLSPIRQRYADILANKKHYKNLIKDSSADIRNIAAQTLREVKDLCGLLHGAKTVKATDQSP